MDNYQQNLDQFNELIQVHKYDPQVLSQIYKMMNYKVKQYQQPTQNIPVEAISKFLSVTHKKHHEQDHQEKDLYDDIRYYDDDKIKELVLKQKFLISKGYFDPKKNFPSIKIKSLDDTSQDHKISQMIDPGFNKL